MLQIRIRTWNVHVGYGAHDSPQSRARDDPWAAPAVAYPGGMLQRSTGVQSVVAVVLCAVLLVGCGEDGASNDDQPADAYILVVEWILAEPEFAPIPAADELALVFVESLGPVDIDLPVQVAIVGHFEDEVAIRFIDSRTEALDDESDGAPVRDGGLLLGLGAVPLDGPLDIRGEVYRTAESVVGYRFRVDRSGPTPVLIKPPERVEPEGLVAGP